MKFAFIPKADYHIGQIIEVHGRKMEIESYSHTGKNVIAHTLPCDLPDAVKFERILCIATDAPPIEEVTT